MNYYSLILSIDENERTAYRLDTTEGLFQLSDPSHSEHICETSRRCGQLKWTGRVHDQASMTKVTSILHSSGHVVGSQSKPCK